ncbi:MAG: N-formylglutamate amidohydrolase [Anderseniella sp.]
MSAQAKTIPAGRFSAPLPLIVNASAPSPIVLVCEHASSFIPPELNDLGLAANQLQGHWAWDPGALGVAETMSTNLDAVLVAAQVSRMVYDCNRPPQAKDAIVVAGEDFQIPGNLGLTGLQRQDRIELVYEPFKAALENIIQTHHSTPVIVTIHSFTRVYHGKQREVEIGILHDVDDRLANAMLSCADEYTDLLVQRNEPYGPQHGVTHTLRKHALPGGFPNVMIEIRNDLIATEAAQKAMGETLANWVNSCLDASGMPMSEGKSS